MASDNKSRWLFSAEQLKMTPSMKRGMTYAEELNQRQTAAGLIRKIGLKLRESVRRPSGLCIDTAMVFMHRFYMFHSFYKYPAHSMAPCCLFLAAKSEETPVKLEYVIRYAHMIRDPYAPALDTTEYEERQRELISHENLLLQTLGFDLVIHHPHTAVINCGDLVGAKKEVTRLAYELATNSLHFTTMCLRYEPTTVACVCLHMAFKRYNLCIPKSNENVEWWNYLDSKLKYETINEITREFVTVIEQCKRNFNKWISSNNNQQSVSVGSSTSTSAATSTARATSSS